MNALAELPDETDSERLFAFADTLDELLVPELSEASSSAFREARLAVADCAQAIRNIATCLVEEA